MSKKYIMLYSLLLAALWYGCKKDVVADQQNADTFYPRIFKETAMFPTTATIINVGDTIKYRGLLYSPADQVQISWKVNNTEKATTPTFNFVGTAAGDYFVKVEVSYNGEVISRVTEVLVNSATFTRKTYTSIAMEYLTENGAAANVDWTKVTHVAYKVATVTATGTMDVSKGEVNNKAVELTARAHANGVPVLLGVSGALSADGWAVSGSNNMGAVIADATKRAALVLAIKNYLALKKMDGVDIMMTDINSTTANINAAIAAIKPFIDDLRAALPTGSLITVTATTNSYYSRYPDLSTADWVNIHAFEDGVHVGPGIALGQASSYQYMITGANLWKARLAANKIVLGMPAMGLRYNSLDANGNNLSWASYDYVPYSTILTLDPTADTKEYIASAKGIYYNGVPLVTQKAAYAKSSGYAGVYLWAGDADVLGAKSLMGAMYTASN